ncbi:MAG: hypothetical protein HY763_08735 [Planctomycetes bacterium]|nr:hypothetical protein [Planctomycetota bacterium]
MTRGLLTIVVVAVGASLFGCAAGVTAGAAGGGVPNQPGDEAAGSVGEPVASAAVLPDFSLRDVNPRSARYDSEVSPRDYLGQVSAWYFGHST